MSKRQPKTDADLVLTHGVAARSQTHEAVAEWVPLDALAPWAQNPRKNDRNLAHVVASIKRFGFAAPIIARRADGEIIAGHTRYAAAKELGLDRVPVRYLDLDPADAHLLALADNRLSDLGEWDNARLLELLGDLRQQGADAALVAGWDDAAIDAMLTRAGDEIAGAVERDADDAFGALPTHGEPETQTMSFLLSAADRAIVRDALAQTGARGTSAQLVAVCRAYLGG